MQNFKTNCMTFCMLPVCCHPNLLTPLQ